MDTYKDGGRRYSFRPIELNHSIVIGSCSDIICSKMSIRQLVISNRDPNIEYCIDKERSTSTKEGRVVYIRQSICTNKTNDITGEKSVYYILSLPFRLR